MLYFLPDLWKKEKLVFPTFGDSLFDENHSLILINSSLSVLNKVVMLLCSKDKLASSANIIGSRMFAIREIFYIQQKTCGTPHLISGTSDQSLFRLQDKFRKIPLLVIYFLTKFDNII